MLALFFTSSSFALAETPPSTESSGAWGIIGSFLSGVGGVVGSFFGPIAGAFGWLLVQVSSWFMLATSTLFSTLIEHLIIDFGGTLQSLGILQGIETVWTAFRDLGNILIIGMFTFIAIGTILGIEQYGARKMIARVLIVAVLINFSLLFTKLAIDASNLVAHQFYKAASFSTTSSGVGAGATAAQAVQNSGGIGGVFLAKTGVSSAFDNLTAMIGSGFSQGFWFIVTYSIATTTLFLILAGIFLYGSILIISRSLVLVLLMVTSALALASSLVPSVGYGKFSWKGWFSMLMQTAAFAPLLMIFLWAALTILSAAPPSSVSLAAYMKDPTNPSSWTVIFMYLFATGLLFAAIKAASSVASGLPLSGVASIAGILPAALGARLAGGLLRNTVGRGGLAASSRLQTLSQDQNRSDFARRLYDFGSVATKKAAQRDFNLMRTSVGAGIIAGAGAKKLDLITGKALKGFEGAQKAGAQASAERTARMAPTKEQQETVRSEELRAALAADPDRAQRHAEAEDDKISAMKMIETLGEQQKQMQEEMATSLRTLEETARNTQAALAANPGSAAAQNARRNAEQALETARRQHETELGEQKDRIEAARKQVTRSETIQKNVEAELEKAGHLKPAFDAEKYAFDTAHNRFSNVLRKTLAKATRNVVVTAPDPDKDKFAKMAVKMFKKQKTKKEFEDTPLSDALKDAIKNQGGGHP